MSNILDEKASAIVEEILLEELAVPRDQLTDDARIEEDLGADSLTVAEIVIAVESRFDVVIPDEMAWRIKTVRNLREALAELLRVSDQR